VYVCVCVCAAATKVAQLIFSAVCILFAIVISYNNKEKAEKKNKLFPLCTVFLFFLLLLILLLLLLLLFVSALCLDLIWSFACLATKVAQLFLFGCKQVCLVFLLFLQPATLTATPAEQHQVDLSLFCTLLLLLLLSIFEEIPLQQQ